MPVKFSVRGRDLASTVAEAQDKVGAKVKLPYDSHLEWGGEMNELGDAIGRLVIIVPVHAAAHRLPRLRRHAKLDRHAHRGRVHPGRVHGRRRSRSSSRGVHFSVSAAMGFISIFGIAIQDAILVVTYFQRLRLVDGLSLEDAAREAGEKRFRPALMTTLVATLGLLPAALSNGIGAQTQKPLAVVVIGGSMILALTSRIRQPALIVLLHRWLDKYSKASPGSIAPPSYDHHEHGVS